MGLWEVLGSSANVDKKENLTMKKNLFKVVLNCLRIFLHLFHLK